MRTMNINGLFVAALMVIVLAASCQQSGERIQRSYWPGGQTKEVWTEVLSEDQRWLKSGLSTTYYESGRERERGMYAFGQRTGLWQSWYDNNWSAPLMQGRYVAGEMDSVWEYWMDPAHHGAASHTGSHSSHNSGGSMGKDSALVADQRKPHKREAYKAGKAHGLWMSWHSEHQIADSIYYVDGKLEGKVVSYFANGSLASEAHYADGALVSEVKIWNEAGELIK